MAKGKNDVATGERQDVPTAEQMAAEQERRARLAELNRLLAGKRCRACTTVGMWGVNRNEGRVCYLVCKACGHSDKVIVVVESMTPPAGEQATA